MTALEQALALHQRGLHVFPVPRPQPGAPDGEPGDGKVTRLPWKVYQHQQPSVAQLESWFVTEQNLAIIAGAGSGVVVVDADNPMAVRWVTRHLPYTPWQTKTSRGFHVYYAHPGVKVPNKSKVVTNEGQLELDVRGDGGYAIAAGSLHASGTWYEEAGDWSVPRDHLPKFWVGWIKAKARPSAPLPTGPRPTGDVVQRARRYLDAIPVPEIGQGSDHDTLYAAARLARAFGLTEADATALLWDWAGGRDGWTHEWVAHKVRNALQYGTEPIGALR